MLLFTAAVAAAQDQPGGDKHAAAADEAAAACCGAVVVLGPVCLGLLSALIYPIPTVITFMRRHPNAVANMAVNLLLGWSFLGWVAALVWSLTATTPTQVHHYHEAAPEPAPPRRARRAPTQQTDPDNPFDCS